MKFTSRGFIVSLRIFVVLISVNLFTAARSSAQTYWDLNPFHIGIDISVYAQDARGELVSASGNIYEGNGIRYAAIFRTNDAGQTWVVQRPPVEQMGVDFGAQL